MAENDSFSKYVLPLGLVTLGFFAFNRFFPSKKQETRDVLTDTGAIIQVVDDRSFLEKLFGLNDAGNPQDVPTSSGLKPADDYLGIYDKYQIKTSPVFRDNQQVQAIDLTEESAIAKLTKAGFKTDLVGGFSDISGGVGVALPPPQFRNYPTNAPIHQSESVAAQLVQQELAGNKGASAEFLKSVRSGATTSTQVQVEIEKQRSAEAASQGRVEVSRISGESEDSRRARLKTARTQAVNSAFERIRTGKLLGR